MKTIKDCIKTRVIKEVPVVNMIIEVNNNSPVRKEGWTYIDNFDFDSEINYIPYKEQMENNNGIERYYYNEWNNDIRLSFRFVNINNKELEEYKDMVDEIAEYIYDIRMGKNEISTIYEVHQWLGKNLNNIIEKYR